MNALTRDEFFDALVALLEDQGKREGDFQAAVDAMCALYSFTRGQTTDEHTALNILESSLGFAVRQWRHAEALVTSEDAIETARNKEKSNGKSSQPDESY